MLTIHPKLAQQYQSNTKVSFRGDSPLTNDENQFYKEKTDFYQDQINSFDDTLNDIHTPKAFKKVINAFKIISEALFEGWMVAWGAKKGSAVIKSSVLAGMQSKVAKKAGEVGQPILKGFESATKILAGHVKTGFEKLANSKFVKSMVAKLEKSKIGRGMLLVARKTGEGIKYIIDKSKNLYTKMKNSKTDFSKSYDNVAEKTATVMGTGAGLTGAYRSTMHPEMDNADNSDIKLEETDDIMGEDD